MHTLKQVRQFPDSMRLWQDFIHAAFASCSTAATHLQ